MDKKVMLVTGASKGIGYSILEYFVKQNIDLIITYNTSRNLSNKVKKYLKEKYNINVYNIKCDISKDKDVLKLYNFVKNKYSRINYLVNNAALSLDSDYVNKTKKEFMKVLEVNTYGTFNMIRTFINDTDYIFNISSMDAFNTGSTYNIDYSCSKATINCMTNYFNIFTESNNIYAICPNWVNTEAIREMNQDFLNDELKRIKQNKLIEPIVIAEIIDNIIKGKIKENIIRIEDGCNE